MYSYNFIITKEDLKIFHKQSKSSTMMYIRQYKSDTIPTMLLIMFCFICIFLLISWYRKYLNFIDVLIWLGFIVYLVRYILSHFMLCLIDKTIIGNVINVELDEDKVSFYGFGNKYVNCPWSSFVNVYKEKNMLFLVPAEAIGKEDIFIPKRLFSTEQEFNEVFNYIKTNIDKNRQLK